MLKVNEIFYSIQGESLYAGFPCAFVRLAGCNLRCSYCDTAYAYSDSTEMSIEEIIDRIESFACRLVEITGGEPLLQKDTPALTAAMLDRGHTVLMETNGSRDISPVDERCIRIVDMKCPGSNQSEKNDYGNLKQLTERDQIKFVISDRADYDFAIRLIQTEGIDALHQTILFSPVHGRLAPALLADWILEDRLHVRLHLQLHKLLWPGKDRGR